MSVDVEKLVAEVAKENAKHDLVRILADRLQRFIPDRKNAEGMAEALLDDIDASGYEIERR